MTSVSCGEEDDVIIENVWKVQLGPGEAMHLVSFSKEARDRPLLSSVSACSAFIILLLLSLSIYLYQKLRR